MSEIEAFYILALVSWICARDVIFGHHFYVWGTVANPTHSFYVIFVRLFMCMVSFSSKIVLVRICQDDKFLCCKCCQKILITVKCALQNYNKCKRHKKYICIYYNSIIQHLF